MNNKMITKDKLDHMIYSYGISLTAAFAIYFKNTDLMLLGALVGMAFGVAWELYGKYFKNKPIDKKDLLADLYGNLAGAGIPYFIIAIFDK